MQSPGNNQTTTHERKATGSRGFVWLHAAAGSVFAISSRLHDEAMMGKQSSTSRLTSKRENAGSVWRRALRVHACVIKHVQILSNRPQPALLGKGVYIRHFQCLIVPNLNAADAVLTQ
jgi:hypothetical protein